MKEYTKKYEQINTHRHYPIFARFTA